MTSTDGQSPDLSAVPSFLSGTTGTLDFFDQSGNGNDPTSVSASRPPMILANAINGKQGVTMGVSPTTGVSANAFLTLPAGLSNARRSLTVISAFAIEPGPENSWGLWTIGVVTDAASDTQVVYDTTGNSAPLYVIDNNFRAGTSPSTGQIITYSVLSGSSNLKVRINGVSTSLTAATAITLTSGRWGRAGWSSATSGNADHFAFIVYPAQLSDAEAASDEAVLNTVFVISPSPKRLLTFDGDSITRGGVGNDYGRTLAHQTIPLITNMIYTPNFAVSGQTAAQIYARSNTTFTKSYNAGNSSNVVAVLMGTNDIAALSVSFANTATTNATFTSASKVIAVVSSTGMAMGNGFIATNIPNTAKIVSVDSSVQVTLDTFPTGTGAAASATTIDYAIISSSAATIFNNSIAPYVAAAKTFGFSGVVVGTIIPRFWSGVPSSTPASIFAMDQTRLALNLLIIANAIGDGYAVADYGGISALSTGNATNVPNSTYYYTVDLIHPNALGYALMAPLLAAAANPLVI